MFSFQSTLPVHLKVFSHCRSFLTLFVQGDGAILFWFIWRFHFVIEASSLYDSRRHGDIAQMHPNFILTLRRHFADMNVKNPYLLSH